MSGKDLGQDCADQPVGGPVDLLPQEPRVQTGDPAEGRSVSDLLEPGRKLLREQGLETTYHGMKWYIVRPNKGAWGRRGVHPSMRHAFAFDSEADAILYWLRNQIYAGEARESRERAIDSAERVVADRGSQSAWGKPRSIFIAGPMRGKPGWNHAAFDAAAERLRSLGWSVWNPAEEDRKRGVTAETTELPDNSLRDAMAENLPALCQCDAICLLPGWDRSELANVERALASALGIQVWAWASDGEDFTRSPLVRIEERPGPVENRDAFNISAQDAGQFRSSSSKLADEVRKIAEIIPTFQDRMAEIRDLVMREYEIASRELMEAMTEGEGYEKDRADKRQSSLWTIANLLGNLSSPQNPAGERQRESEPENAESDDSDDFQVLGIADGCKAIHRVHDQRDAENAESDEVRRIFDELEARLASLHAHVSDRVNLYRIQNPDAPPLGISLASFDNVARILADLSNRATPGREHRYSTDFSKASQFPYKPPEAESDDSDTFDVAFELATKSKHMPVYGLGFQVLDIESGETLPASALKIEVNCEALAKVTISSRGRREFENCIGVRIIAERDDERVLDITAIRIRNDLQPKGAPLFGARVHDVIQRLQKARTTRKGWLESIRGWWRKCRSETRPTNDNGPAPIHREPAATPAPPGRPKNVLKGRNGPPPTGRLKKPKPSGPPPRGHQPDIPNPINKGRSDG